jgi:hypothetical protein
MKKIIPILLIILCQACLLTRFIKPIVKSTPIISTPQESTPTVDSSAVDLSAVCRADVDGIRSLLTGLSLPEHFAYQREGDFIRHEGDFDPNAFLTVLTHLNMFPNYTLDYIFIDAGLGGYPQLYARLKDYAPYTEPDVYQQSLQMVTPAPSFFSQLDPSKAYLDRVLTDGTPESYLEYLLLANYGDQFYLAWHANYNDSMILCDSSDLILLNEEVKTFGDSQTLPADVLSASQKLDLTPTVRMDENQVIIRYVFFSKWAGFIEEIYTLDRTNPYLVINRHTTPLVEYNCGIMF